ncbi:YqiA/YcfP family alpha/beta fold hydrolase [Halomonas sp. CUBES01]|uniref:YqiA/YcfP family alpha/beta fold hydrolase n=1 Tax=Vreelandella gomseomensis TaxID=370766 RepID=A0ABU1GCY6_9GAMM|nr:MULTISPECIES: YqiA/YcfP family alpha/beta fold hydrolase [Halomonas]MDR5875157.1 YqiA/YcfP family alpha/beta fold hydrolase [Halomonas gomseomensis]MEC4765980.1 YqiA/YcfP family alpha/beta fold hydrolase [Halomonas sp. CUBES01]
MLTVYLSHGLESGPGALKMQALKGIADKLDDCEAVVMDYRDQPEPQQRLQHLLATLKARGDDPERCVLAGSSLGGWLSAAVSAQQPVLGCFLLAPALGLAHYPETSPTIQARCTHIIHGWQDDVIPPGPVIERAQRQRLSLRMVDDDHRLHESLDTLLSDFDTFLTRCSALLHASSIPCSRR